MDQASSRTLPKMDLRTDITGAERSMDLCHCYKFSLSNVGWTFVSIMLHLFPHSHEIPQLLLYCQTFIFCISLPQLLELLFTEVSKILSIFFLLVQ